MMIKKGWIIAVVLVGVLVCSTLASQAGAPRQRDGWQYRIVTLSNAGGGEGELNGHGADGWEAVTAVQDTENRVTRVILKRRLGQ